MYFFFFGFKVRVDEAAADDNEDLEDAFGVLRFGEIFSFCSSGSEERMGRIYTERDYDCKRRRARSGTHQQKQNTVVAGRLQLTLRFDLTDHRSRQRS